MRKDLLIRVIQPELLQFCVTGCASALRLFSYVIAQFSTVTGNGLGEANSKQSGISVSDCWFASSCVEALPVTAGGMVMCAYLLPVNLPQTLKGTLTIPHVVGM